MNNVKYDKGQQVSNYRTGDLFHDTRGVMYILAQINGKYSAISLNDGCFWNYDHDINGCVGDLTFFKRNATITIS